MDIKVVKKDKKTLEIEMMGESITLPNLISDALWDVSSVSEAATIKEHPYLAEPKIFVKVKKGNPINALKRVCKNIENQLNEFRGKFQKALKK